MWSEAVPLFVFIFLWAVSLAKGLPIFINLCNESTWGNLRFYLTYAFYLVESSFIFYNFFPYSFFGFDLCLKS